jgi:hypothetical protein
VFAGHVKQDEASEEQVMQELEQFKQDEAEFPAGLA